MTEVLALDGVGVRVDGHWVLDAVDWEVTTGQRWALLGPNGSGKTTLVRIASLYLHPTRGVVRVLGQTVGRLDARALRPRIGSTSAAVARMVRRDVSARDVVMTARHGALEAWWHDYGDDDRERATQLLGRFGVGDRADQAFGTLSSGERQRALLARALMTDPDLLLLDEPAAGLDLGGREDLVSRLAALATEPGTPPLVLVTHHVDELPPGLTHALVLGHPSSGARGAGGVLARGPIDEVLVDEVLSDAFGVDLRVRREDDGRWSARAR